MRLALPAALAAALLAASPAHAVRPATSSCDQPRLAEGTYVDIDVAIPGADAIRLRAINERRDIIGWFSDASGATESFLLRGGMAAIIAVPGSTHTWANGLNNAGLVVGAYQDAQGDEHGFTWRDGVFTLYPAPPGTFTALRFGAVNNAGAIAGHYDFEENGVFGAQAFVIRPDGTRTLIDTGFPWAFPVSLNARGDVLISVQGAAPGPGRGSYVLATRHGRVEMVTGCPGLNGFTGQLWTITNQGRLAGRMGSFTSFAGVVYSDAGVTAYHYPGAESTELVGMNSAGYAIGHAGDVTMAQPFLFVPHGR